MDEDILKGLFEAYADSTSPEGAALNFETA